MPHFFPQLSRSRDRSVLRRAGSGCFFLVWLLLVFGCQAPAPTPPLAEEDGSTGESAVERPEWALAIHGGAGVIPKTMESERKEQYFAALRAALEHGRSMLADGASALDTVEQVVRRLEDAEQFNAGKGAVFTNEGKNELDAAIMDGSNLACGAVSGLTTVKNPVSLARMVMEQSPHVFFMGHGAETFADEMGVERVESDYYYTERRWQALQKALTKEKEAEKHGTVGAAALDRHGNLAAATSTGGMTNKRFGRVGDVPIIGAGTYAKNATAAISCTGWGERFIRNTVAHDVSALMEYRGLSLGEAAREVIHGKLEPGDGGLIAVSHTGEIALVFNSEGMFRGGADANGRFDVAIWED